MIIPAHCEPYIHPLRCQEFISNRAEMKMPSWNSTRLCQAEKEGGWWQVFFLILNCITLVQQNKPTHCQDTSLSSNILYFCSIDQVSLIKDISINARKQCSIVFYNRPKAVCSQGETFQILTDCSVFSSLIWKFLLRTMRKELKNGALSVRAGFLGSSQPFWEAEFPILPKGKKIDWYQRTP